MMDIYVGNLPKGIRPTELKKLLKDSVRENVFTRLYEKAADLGRLDEGVDIAIHLLKPKRRKQYRYGHIHISSQRLAPVALDALKDSRIKGKTLKIRPFVVRSAIDRRGDSSSEWTDKSRRKGERRRLQPN